MRFIELLEGVGKYRPMFNMFMQDGQMPAWIDPLIRNIEGIFKREDRVVWALRWMRFHEAYKNGVREDNPMASKLVKGLPSEPFDRLALRALEPELETFKHFFSLPVASIQSYVFDRQTPSDIIETFKEMEEEWQATRKQEIDHRLHYGLGAQAEDNEDQDDDDEDGDDYEGHPNYPYFQYNSWRGETRKNPVYGKPTVLIDFKNGWAWWLLNRAFCEVEGSAMGHCGNSASPNEDDNVLSLRRHIAGDRYRPSCTFILNKHNYLGEMKGRANEKPKPEYHAMIVALLRNPIVHGIDGGGYAVGNNFSVLDLPKETREALLAEKPQLLTTEESAELYKKASPEEKPEMMNRLEIRIRGYLERFGFRNSFKKLVDINRVPHLIIEEWNSIEDYIKQDYEMNSELLSVESLAAGFRSIADLEFEISEKLADEALQRHLYTAVLTYLNNIRANRHALQGLEYRLKNRKLYLIVSVGDVANPTSLEDPESWDEHNDIPANVLDRISSLDSDLEHDPQYSWSDLEVNIDDDIDDATRALVVNIFDGGDESELSALKELLDDVMDYHDHTGGSRTTRDPRQQSFDFDSDATGRD